MSAPWNSRVVLPLALCAAAACGDSTGPTGPLTDFLLDFCANETPVYLAVQNDGANWERVQPDGQGTFAFEAAAAFGLAIVQAQDDGFRTEFIFATAEELEPANGVACTETSGARSLNGTVSGVGASQGSWITMARTYDILDDGQTGFTLGGLPAGPLDLVAHRDVFTLDGPVPDRVIVRRALNLTTGATITPALDFSGGDSQAAATHTLSISGLQAGESNNLLGDFRTAGGTLHFFYSYTDFSGSAQTLFGIPASLTQAGDLHDVDVWGEAGSGYRGVRQFYRTPGDRVAAIGPTLNTPLILLEGQSPYIRLRMQLQAQGDYDAFVSASYLQEESPLEVRTIVVTATAGYIGGTPATWDVTIPLVDRNDFPSQAMLQPGFATTWYVDGFGGGVPATYLGYPADGSSYRYAGRFAAVQLAQFAGAGAARATRSPALARRLPGAR